ncbi:MAG: lyase family protein, partial [Chloroflexota bacterium]
MTLWGGRFDGKLDPAAWLLNASLPVDQRLGPQDVRGSQAWAHGLHQAGVLSIDEHAAIQSGLQAIAGELETGTFVFLPGDEDIHSAVERRLGELIGAPAGKLHTGRSRNDQVATDFRLWVLQALPAIDAALRGLQAALLARAEAAGEILLPGYTHLQRAQPVMAAHYWLAYIEKFQRDRERLADCR